MYGGLLIFKCAHWFSCGCVTELLSVCNKTVFGGKM
jgi:hypothetical protein